MQSLLAVSRIAAGLGFLTLPGPVATLFRMPFTTEAGIGCRMAGARDIVIGALLYTSLTRSSNATSADTRDAKTNSSRQDPRERVWSARQRALAAGIAVDAIDVLACLWCYFDGSFPATPALLLGGGAAVLLDLGIYCWYF
ncbi:hypothetical protein BJX66DRAFT_332515 [Aspergillus keveii]|uniref:Uncharacterized protein n=1 Tax=Aspergillus keveii TaxID=714993 RepID=A0ABR4GMY3_9EURO